MPEMFREWLPVANSIILLLIGAGAFYKYSQWRTLEEKRKRDASEDQRRLIREVCEQFTKDDAFRDAADRRSREIADVQINEAFTRRAGSFVDAQSYEKVHAAETRALESNFKRISDDIRVLAAEVASLSKEVHDKVRA